MVKVGIDRYETSCATCRRTSPGQSGSLADAEAKLKALAWTLDVEGHWHCPICTTRTTTKVRRFES